MYNYDTERMRQVAREITELLDANRTSGPNPTVLNQLEEYASEFQGQGTVASEKTQKVLGFANEFYSDNTQEQHTEGANFYIPRMLACADAIHTSSLRYDANQAKREATDQQ